MPGRTASRTCCTVAARMRPPSAISSISRALLSWITPLPRSRRQHPEGAGGHVLHRAHRVDHARPWCHAACTSRAPGAVCSSYTAAGCGSPPARRPCGARACRRTCRTACPARGPCTGVWHVLADGAAGEPAHDLVVVDVEAEHRVHLLAQLRASRVASPSACGTVRTTPSRITPLGACAARSAPPS